MVRDATESWVGAADGSPTTVVDRVAGVSTFEGYCWLLVAVALLADLHLTAIGLQHGFAEGNPAMAPLIGAVGIGGLLLSKAAVLGIAGLFRAHWPRFGPVVPLGVALPWLVAAAVNAARLL
ncbi:MAG: DUF5658 family protein [Haloarculaceae archaeon]